MTKFWEQSGQGTVFIPLDVDDPASTRYTQPRLLYENGVLLGICDEGGELLYPVVNGTAFGITADGTTDDTAALQAAITATEGGTLYLPQGTIKITGPVYFNDNGQTIIGSGADGTVIYCATDTAKIVCDDYNYCSLRGVKLDGRDERTSGELLYIANCSCFLAEWIRIEDGYNGVTVVSTNNVTFENFVIASNTGAHGIKWSGTSSARSDVLKLVNGEISHGSNDNIDSILWHSHAHSMTLLNVRIISGGRGLYAVRTDTSTADGITWPQFLQASMLEIDFPNKEAIRLDNFRDAWINNLYVHGSETESGILLGSDVYSVRMTNGRVASSYKHGISLDGRFTQIIGFRIYTNSQAASNTYDGIYIGANAADVAISGCQIGYSNTFGTSQRYGINADSAATRVYVDPVQDLNGNVTGPYNYDEDIEYYAPTDNRHEFRNAGGVHFQIGSSDPAAVNYFRAGGEGTGESPTFRAEGADTNIDIRMIPKGTGRLRFGTFTANADAPITGYLEVKDEATGTVRKLAIIA